MPMNCGHCVYPRIKERVPDHKACEHFVERELPHEDNDIDLYIG